MYIFLSLLVCPCKIFWQCLNFYRIHIEKSTKNCKFAVFYSMKTDYMMSGRLEILYINFLAPLDCPCKISCQCLDFCRSHAQKGIKKSIFFSILQYKNILYDVRETWNLVYTFLSPGVFPCRISCQYLAFCRSHAQKGTKNHYFAVFYSKETGFLMSGRYEI